MSAQNNATTTNTSMETNAKIAPMSVQNVRFLGVVLYVRTLSFLFYHKMAFVNQNAN
jgi:hypothetical protein